MICKQEEIIHKNDDGDAHDDGDAAHDILLGQGGDHSVRWMEDAYGYAVLGFSLCVVSGQCFLSICCEHKNSGKDELQ